MSAVIVAVKFASGSGGFSIPGFPSLFQLEQHHEFSFPRTFPKFGDAFRSRSANELFEFFREFAGDDHSMVRTEMFLDFRERFLDSVYALVGDDGVILGFQRFEQGFPAFFYRQETEEPEIVRMQSRTYERRKHGRRTRDWGNRNILVECGAHERIGRIGDARSSRVRDDRAGKAFFERIEDFYNLGRAGMRMVGQERFFNFVMPEEDSRGPSVFAGDEIDLLEDSDGAVGDIFEVADRRGDEVEHILACVIYQIRHRSVFRDRGRNR